jgi:tetrahydromethanopterin S-methyltransferase subunit B
MFSYLKGTDKYNERVEKLDRLAGDITDDVDADPEAQMISSSSAQSYYDVEEQAKKLKAILDAQEKDFRNRTRPKNEHRCFKKRDCI